MRILLLNGPNLNTLGSREPEIYGTTTLSEIESAVAKRAADTAGATVDCFQSNDEGALIDWLQANGGSADGLIINAGALTHYGMALRDAVAALDRPTIEVHISNVWKREAFRHESLLSPVCAGVIVGLGAHGYLLAVEAVIERIDAGKAT